MEIIEIEKEYYSFNLKYHTRCSIECFDSMYTVNINVWNIVTRQGKCTASFHDTMKEAKKSVRKQLGLMYYFLRWRIK